MTALPTSVVVVSRHRAAELVRCLGGLAQSDHPMMELVVVADPVGVSAALESGVGPLKTIVFDDANISAARNLGIAEAAGAVVAFIDDDAVPEPTWLSQLVAPFTEERVAAAGGFVRGRNGISFQWQAREVDRTGVAHPLAVDPVTPSLHRGTPERAIKTEGTNMAFRRDVLLAMGGFDEGFRFYLDETDLNLRLALAGYVTAIVPLAQVYHGFAASARRSAARVPLDLTDIGASTALFLHKHAEPARHGLALAALRADQLARLERLRLPSSEIARLMLGLEAGIARRVDSTQPPTPTAPPPFLPLTGTGPKPWVMLSGWQFQARRLRRRAMAETTAGKLAMVFVFSLTARPHRLYFHPEGYWEQSGGLFGRSDRSGPRLRFFTRKGRVQAERARLSGLRNLVTSHP